MNFSWRIIAKFYNKVELTIPILQLQILESDGVSDKEYIEQKFQTSLTKTENLTASEQTISSANILSSGKYIPIFAYLYTECFLSSYAT